MLANNFSTTPHWYFSTQSIRIWTNDSMDLHYSTRHRRHFFHIYISLNLYWNTIGSSGFQMLAFNCLIRPHWYFSTESIGIWTRFPQVIQYDLHYSTRSRHHFFCTYSPYYIPKYCITVRLPDAGKVTHINTIDS